MDLNVAWAACAHYFRQHLARSLSQPHCAPCLTREQEREREERGRAGGESSEVAGESTSEYLGARWPPPDFFVSRCLAGPNNAPESSGNSNCRQTTLACATPASSSSHSSLVGGTARR